MTFKEFMASTIQRANFEGDFIRLALADANFPAGDNFADFRRYMRKMHGSDDVADGGAAVWKAYRAAERKRTKPAVLTPN
ncbi:MAG: hypothetical protein JWS10_937 [Cypionkella sp.]|uniref:hypothetical protein n=1 Tax=Cypionkella sp. TaxID=2811411 RepID=UPI00262FB832|nr:hypothetical protein [Cypionkella sp.]MDB5658322.1 hypothetical protein [Cypionkella sp.]